MTTNWATAAVDVLTPRRPFLFYLGTHQPHWLGTSPHSLFVSHNRLKSRKSFPRARAPWALDSGAFSELSTGGRWVTSESEYIESARRYMRGIGSLQWAAPMDWMCEPNILTLTRKTVGMHQGLTVDNVASLRAKAPDVPWIPVLQGWTVDEYVACISFYMAAGIDLTRESVVGVGSVCRRQGTVEIADLFRELSIAGLRLHGFGVKTSGLRMYARHLVSADSMAWSFDARRNPPLPGHTHKNCANCWPYARAWRQRLLAGWPS